MKGTLVSQSSNATTRPTPPGSELAGLRRWAFEQTDERLTPAQRVQDAKRIIEYVVGQAETDGEVNPGEG